MADPVPAGLHVRADRIAMVGTDILVPEVEADAARPDGAMRRLRVTTLLLYND